MLRAIKTAWAITGPSGAAVIIFTVGVVLAAAVLGSAAADHLPADIAAKMTPGMAVLAHGIDTYADLPSLVQVLLPATIALMAGTGAVVGLALWWRKGDKGDLSAIVALCEETSRSVHSIQEQVTEYRVEMAELRATVRALEGDRE